MIHAIPEAEPIMRTYSQTLREQGREEGLKQGLEQGLEQGREQGREQGLRVFIVDLLEARGFALTLEHRVRIQTCGSLDTLQRWYTAAKSAPLDQPVERLLELSADEPL